APVRRTHGGSALVARATRVSTLRCIPATPTAGFSRRTICTIVGSIISTGTPSSNRELRHGCFAFGLTGSTAVSTVIQAFADREFREHPHGPPRRSRPPRIAGRAQHQPAARARAPAGGGAKPQRHPDRGRGFPPLRKRMLRRIPALYRKRGVATARARRPRQGAADADAEPGQLSGHGWTHHTLPDALLGKD